MPNRERPLILLAEDEANVSLVTRTRLEANGFRVRTAADGEEALTLLRKLKPSLVLLDLKMPKLDGYQVCRFIKQNPATRAVPVILFSASSSHSLALRDKCLELGADDHIRKPYHPDELLSKVRRLIQRETLDARHPESGAAPAAQDTGPAADRLEPARSYSHGSEATDHRAEAA
ncbi:MAG: response regulator, partial [candidate division WOR-3 bacterium]